MTRIAVIGAGRMGKVHLGLLRGLPNVDVTAIVDPIVTSATHKDVDELLNDDPPDGAVVAAPSTLHLEVVTRLLDAGIPTLCEKPCGTASSVARAAVAHAERTGTPLQIGYWRRFIPELRALRERIAAGDLGEVLLIRSEQWDVEPPSEGFRAASGGILIDMGVHELDQIRWLTGQELTVGGVVASSARVGGDPDSVEATFVLSGGGVAGVSLGRRYPPGDMCRVTVHGSRGVEECPFVWPPDSESAFAAGIGAQNAAFIELVCGSAQQGATADDAVAALEAAESAAALL